MGALSPVARAETLTIPFNSTGKIESHTAVVNLFSNSLHSPLIVSGIQVTGPSTPYSQTFDIGDGHLGPFNAQTYLKFHSGTYNNDQVIRIDTDVYPALDVTAFELDAGWTLRPKGSKPLIIHSQSDIVVNGTIECSGSQGSDFNADITQSSAGGAGICGGGDGGRGGSVSETPQNGAVLVTGSTMTAGQFGPATGDGGGGGGAFSQPASNATDGSVFGGGGSAGSAGLNQQDDAFTLLGGGAGGGGGAMYNTPGDEVNFSTGGGGGAGGGVIVMNAFGNVTVGASGNVLANGGNGGGVSGTVKGGAGGGGGGGSILMFAGGIIDNSGTITALEGAGGASAGGGTGGTGGRGRTWLTDKNGVPTGNVEDPVNLLVTPGTVQFALGEYQVVSTLFDSENTLTTFNSASLDFTLSGASNVALDMAAEKSSFAAADSVWTSSADLSSLQKMRYFRFKITLNNQSSTDPVQVRSVSVTYSPGTQNDFKFSPQGCGTVALKGSSYGHKKENSMVIFLLLIPLLLAACLRFTKLNQE